VLVGIGFLVAAAILAYMASTYTTEFRPAPGGTYVEAVGGYPQTLNPLLSQYSDADSDVVSLVFSGLTQLDMQGEVVPDLATGWSVDESGITYTFRLNRNVTWHDGYPFSAEDVVFTLELLQDPDFPGPPDIAELWRAVAVTEVDDYTLQFSLQEPYAPFLDFTTIGILPKHKLEGVRAADLGRLDFNREPVGTGPFRLVDLALGEGHISSVTLRRFPRYYGRTAYIESLELQFYATPRAAFDAYRDGVVEGVARLPTGLLPEAFAEESLELFSAPTAEMSMVFFNELVTDTLPFADTRVRQALTYGLDRQRLVDDVLLGQAVLPATPLLPGTWAYATDGVPAYELDRERAWELMAVAGWRRGSMTDTLRNDAGVPLAFSLVVANSTEDLAVANGIAEQWHLLGVSVTVESVPALALTGVLESRVYDAAVARLIVAGDPDPYPFWHETQALPGQGQNYAGFQHRRISELVEQARTTVRRDERVTLYREFQQLFMQEVPAIPLYVPVYTYGLDTRVNGAQLGPVMSSGDRFLTVMDWYVLQRRVVAAAEPGE